MSTGYVVFAKENPRAMKKKGGVFGRWLAAMMFAGLALLAAGAWQVVGAEALDDAAPDIGMWLALTGVYAGCALAAWVALKLSNWRGDEAFAGGMFVLCALGMLVQARLGVFAKEGVWTSMTGLGMPAGTAVFVAAAIFLKGGRLNDKAWLGYACYALAIVALAGMRLFGREYRGGFYLPGGLNPTEIVKPLLVVFTAAFLHRRGKMFAQTQLGLPMPPAREMLLFGALWLVPMALVFALRDLGFLILLNMALVVMLYAATGRFRYIPLGVLAGAAVCTLMAAITRNAAARVAMWRDPFTDPTGKGWQALHALMAMFAGGTFGAGLGEGTPGVVPIVTSDFVYASVAEELGLLGCLLALAFYAAWFARGWRVAGAAGNGFTLLLGVGIVASLAAQTLVNIAGVAKALPMTGVTLPLVSQGSSSLVVVMGMCGLLAALSDRR